MIRFTRQLAIMCDLDGTLCKMNGRKFNEYDKVGEDLCVEPVRLVIDTFDTANYAILLVSGRENTGYCRSLTELWLKSHGIFYEHLFMRECKDYRSDDVVKKEIYLTKIEPHYDVQFVLDDRDKVVKMWRELGLTCFQVAYGDF